MASPTITETNTPAGVEVNTDTERDEARRRRREELIAMLDSWDDDDPEDQRETWALLQESLPHLRVVIDTRDPDA